MVWFIALPFTFLFSSFIILYPASKSNFSRANSSFCFVSLTMRGVIIAIFWGDVGDLPGKYEINVNGYPSLDCPPLGLEILLPPLTVPMFTFAVYLGAVSLRLWETRPSMRVSILPRSEFTFLSSCVNSSFMSLS